jgi:hypothetical protein
MSRLAFAVALATVAALPSVTSAQARPAPRPATAPASASAFEPGDKLVSGGLLIGTGGGGDFDGGTTSGFGLTGQFEVGVKRFTPNLALGVGGSLGYSRDSDDFVGGDIDLSAIPVAAIGNLHVTWPGAPKELDLFGGASLGFTRYSLSVDGLGIGDRSSSETEVLIGVQAGARWYFTPTFAAMGQLQAGNNVPFATFGVSFKF